MAKIAAYVTDAELFHNNDHVTVHRMPVDENDELVEKDTYDWEIAVDGKGCITVYTDTNDVFTFKPLKKNFRKALDKAGLVR